MEVRLVILGAFLALLGAFLTQIYKNYNQMKKADRKNLLEALELLQKLKSILENNSYANQYHAIIEPCKALLLCSSRIQTRKYRQLAFKLVDFAKKRERREKDEVIGLIEEVSEKISKPLDMFHKKENKLFEKAMKEIQRDYERRE